MSIWPKAFGKSIDDLLGKESSELFEALETSPPTSIRINPGKNVSKFQGEPVLWNKYGTQLPERPSFVDDPAFFAGAYYVQESSSMVIGYIAQKLAQNKKIEKVLDLCAAPGGKSTDLITSLPKAELVVSNELVRKRAAVLHENIAKWGNWNSVVTHSRSEAFTRLPDFFDLVVVDAPCSGEGMFRKDKTARELWSPNLVESCKAIQKELILDAFTTLKEGGHLVYSTCTFNRKENEDVVNFLLENTDGEIITFPEFPNWGITDFHPTYRFFPHKTPGEGFSVSVIRKNGPYRKSRDLGGSRKKDVASIKDSKSQIPWLKWEESHLNLDFQGDQFIAPKSIYPILKEPHINILFPGVNIGHKSRKGFIPNHPLALNEVLDKSAVEILEVDEFEALKYLRRHPIEAKNGLKDGFHLVSYLGLGLGWSKLVKGRVNSHLPKDLRIRKSL